MTDIKKLIEEEANEASELYYFSSDGKRVSAGLNPIKNEAWRSGALWAMRWWAERWRTRYSLITKNEYDKYLDLMIELDEAVKQILEDE